MKHAVSLLLWRILHLRKLNKQLAKEQSLARSRRELRMALALKSQARSVSSATGLQDKSFQVVLLRRPYGVELSLVLIGSNSSLVILEGQVVDLADGSYIQPFAKFSLN
jgi:hypothetical protein